jgi:hypothetical protein
MNSKAKIWFSAGELSLLGGERVAGLPTTMPGCTGRAKKEEWLSRETPCMGGKAGMRTEYQPPPPVLALIQSFLEANPDFLNKRKPSLTQRLAEGFPNTMAARLAKEFSGSAAARLAEEFSGSTAARLASERPDSASAGVMMHMAGVSTRTIPGVAQAIDESLLSACHAACRAVYGDKFDAESAVVQMGYATDLYGLLVRFCASNEKDLGEMKRLEVNALIELLRIYVRLSWARKFPPPAPNSYSF